MANKVFCDISISADGYAAGPGQTAEKPFGDGPVDRLHSWMFDTPDENKAEIGHDRGQPDGRPVRRHPERTPRAALMEGIVPWAGHIGAGSQAKLPVTCRCIYLDSR